jgi:hypothetical protein
MNLKPLAVLVVASIAGLSACSNTPPADSLPVPAPAATSAASAQNALADFSVDPGHVFACDGRDRTISTVKWRVKDPAVKTVKVDVDTALKPERKEFAAGGATGEAHTGNWVVAGARFHLLDGATDKELASYEVTSLPCQ